MDDNTFETITWSAPEYTHKDRSVDFFWTIGLATIIGAILALWFHDYVFALFIFISGGCLILFTIRPPQEVSFSVGAHAITIARDTYPWESVHGFTIKRQKDDEPYAKLLIKTSRYFLPIFTIPLPPELATDVRDALFTVTKHIELEESPSMQFMEKMGF